MKIFRKALVAFGFMLFVVTPIFAIATPSSVSALTRDDTCERSILGIHPWFRGLAVREDGKCVIAGPGQEIDGKTLDLSGFIWRIALNLIEIALGVVAYIAFFFILYGGFQFLTGGSNPSQIEKARKTILNAVIGLVISIGAVAIVNLVFGIIG